MAIKTDGLKKGLMKVKTFVKKNGPTIMMVVGTVSSIGAVVTAAEAAPKAKEIIDECKENIAITVEAKKVSDEGISEKTYTEKDMIIEQRNSYIYAGKMLIKAAWKPIVLETLALTCFWGAHIKMGKVLAATAMVASARQAKIDELMSGIKNKYGEEAANDIYYGAVEKEVETTEVDKKGKEKTVKHIQKTFTKGSEWSQFIYLTKDAAEQNGRRSYCVDLRPGYGQRNKTEVRGFVKYCIDTVKYGGTVTVNDIYNHYEGAKTNAGLIYGIDPDHPEEFDIVAVNGWDGDEGVLLFDLKGIVPLYGNIRSDVYDPAYVD